MSGRAIRWLLVVASALGTTRPASGGAPTLTVAMRLAEAEWRVIQEAMRHGVSRRQVASWAGYERIVSEAAERIMWRREPLDQALPPLAQRLAASRGGRP
jgi:hypothetical protein